MDQIEKIVNISDVFITNGVKAELDKKYITADDFKKRLLIEVNNKLLFENFIITIYGVEVMIQIEGHNAEVTIVK
jgi:hypothetical protein